MKISNLVLKAYIKGQNTIKKFNKGMELQTLLLVIALTAAGLFTLYLLFGDAMTQWADEFLNKISFSPA